MRVLLAGATGAIGRPLTRALIRGGHQVLALARTDGSAAAVRALGAEPVRADVLDRDGLLRAVDGLAADAVIHQLTALKAPKRTLTADDPSNVLRGRGTTNLLEAAGALGAGRFLTQSLVLGYGYRDHGDRFLTEEDPFGVGVLNGSVADHVITGLVEAEGRLFAAAHVAGTALRYGVFYGPGTWFDPTPGSRAMPVPLGGGGVVPWVHVEDAAEATVAALERGRAGEAYNIVDDRPSHWGELAAARGGRRILLPGWALRTMVPYLGELMLKTRLRVSHAKATSELGWTPRYPDHRAGMRAA
ncbi:NAD(P)-dependent oxidoreductase [Streptomyces sp. NPDC007369]|uniref:NAD-dependent epimerase/dehydratase family protein n=1 Tax=Streptomyces sp. NPDC007369 TaxID=3154589 RepID=UPI0033C87C46